MKICVVTPSAEYQRQAGARIRYQRLVEPLQRLGHDLVLRPLDRFESAADLSDDVYLLSKCHDPRALLLARLARGLGRPVGIDLFDDYFSQAADSRFSRLRYWFAAAVDSADFLLCSTPAMRAVSAAGAPGLPAHVMNDPFERFDADALAQTLAEKRDRLRQTGLLEVAWFGTGDNPHFPVGLSDLVAFSDMLARLKGRGLGVRLRILTNRRAMTSPALAALARLPVPHLLEEWSEEAEAALLKQSYAAFLPVNAQPFSVAKSLNRAVTALTAGAQVLSAGYALYAPFADVLYRDPLALVDDARSGEPRLRPDTVADFACILERVADREREARELVDFLTGLTPPARVPATPAAALVHGRDSVPALHHFAHALGMLSVGTPLSAHALDYDVKITPGQDAAGLEIWLHPRVTNAVTGAFAELHTSACAPGRRYRISAASPGDMRGIDLSGLPHPTAQAAAHPVILGQVARVLDRLFPGLPLILSEDFAFAWPVPSGFAGAPSFKPR